MDFRYENIDGSILERILPVSGIGVRDKEVRRWVLKGLLFNDENGRAGNQPRLVPTQVKVPLYYDQ